MTSALQYAIVGTGSIGPVLAQRFSDHHVPHSSPTREVRRRSTSPNCPTHHAGHPRHSPGCGRDHPGHPVLRSASWVGAAPTGPARSSSTRRTRSWCPIPRTSSAAACRPISTPRPSPAPRWSSRSTKLPPGSSRRGAHPSSETRSLRVQQRLRGERGRGRAMHRSRLRPDRTRPHRRGWRTHPGPQCAGLAQLYELPSELETNMG